MNKSIQEYIFIFIRGLLMGVCDLIPGVSGGTIALITGIYERLISAIGNIHPRLLFTLLKLDIEGFIGELKKIDVVFLISLAAGIGVAMFTFSRVILFLLGSFAAETYSFFLGLIAASAILILLEIKTGTKKSVIAVSLIAGLIIGYLLGGLHTWELGHSFPVLFLSGMAALCAMILPGISGAYITLILNQYEYLLECLHSYQFVPLIVYGVGGIIGLLLFTKLLKYLLKNYHAVMLALLTGVMLGSSRLLITKVEGAGGFMLPAIIACVGGIFLVVLLEFVKRKFESKKNEGEKQKDPQ